VGKLICWGEDRPTAIARTLRALREFRIEGIATTIPADIAILEHPDFATATHSTKWVEDTLDLTGVSSTPIATDADAEPKVQRDVDVEVNGKRFAVKVFVPQSQAGAVVAGGVATGAAKPRRGAAGGSGGAGGGSGAVTVPMQGTIVKILVEVGQAVEAGATVCVLEAMKMENNIASEKAGTVKEIKVSTGDSVGAGDVVVIIE
jgi:acetyl-CoA/propionyl-CoA carboxylase biotin carboxyl carrier protein